MSGPSRLTMIHENMCRTCGNMVDKCHILRTEMLYGWYFCERCTHIVHNEAKQNMKHNIPLHGVLTKYEPIIFPRSDGSEWVGIIDPTEFCLTLIYEHNKYFVKIVFNTENSNKVIKQFEYSTNVQKHIDLLTLYEYNPSIYFKLIKCNNLFGSSIIQIGYDELDNDIKQIIRYEKPYRVMEILLNRNIIIDLANIISVYLFGDN